MQIRLIKEFPRTITGKLDSTNLFQIPILNKRSSNEGTNTLTGTECIVARIFADLLLLPYESLTASDSFFDCGGDSGKAGLAVSRMRQLDDPKFGSVAVSDLYTSPTIGGLSKIIDGKTLLGSESLNNDISSYVDNDIIIGVPRRKLCSLTQLIVGLILMWLDGLHMLLGYLYFYPLANRLVKQLAIRYHIGDHLEFALITFFPLMLFIWIVAYELINILLLVLVKWTLIGKYREGKFALYGSFYIRHWIVERFNKRVRWSSFYSNPGIRFMLKLMGAKIGVRFFCRLADHSPFGGFDLLDIGDDVSINYAHVTPISFTSDAIVCGKVRLGNSCTILPRATVIGPVSMNEVIECLDVMTYLGNVAGMKNTLSAKVKKDTPLGSWVTGSPARILSNLDYKQRHEMDISSSDSKFWIGCNLGSTLYSLLDFCYMLFERYLFCFIIVIPQALLVRWLPTSMGFFVYVIHPIAFLFSGFCISIIYPGIACFITRKLFPSKKGHYNLYSLQSLVIHYKQRWFSTPQMMLNNTLFMVSFFLYHIFLSFFMRFLLKVIVFSCLLSL
jgi:hypothetical protein